MGLAEIQAIKKLIPAQVYKGKEPTAKVVASLKPKEPKQLRKQSDKAKAQVVEDKAQHEADKLFYAGIWEVSPHVCQCGCKKKLGKEPLFQFFHHLLPKQSFPQFRHEEINIIILHPDCHTAVENSIDNRPIVKKRRAEVEKILLK